MTPKTSTKPKSKTAATAEYGADQIRKLEDRDAVRLRPGMYIDGTGQQNLTILGREIIDNAVDEALAGHCDEITVELSNDGVLTVTDNGRGIPVAKNAEGEHALHLVFEDLHAGGKFGDGGYKVSAGLHGVGASVANFLSDWLKVIVHRDGGEWHAEWSQGVRAQAVKKFRASKKTGTTVMFKYDETVFDQGVVWNPASIENILRDRSYLISGVKFIFKREGHPEQVFYQKSAGIQVYCGALAEEHAPLHKALYFEDDSVSAVDGNGRETEVAVEVALNWTKDATSNILAFTNLVRNGKGGTHVSGLSAALTRSMNNLAYETNRLKKDNGKKPPESFKADDILAGLTAIVSVKVTDPQFGGQTKHTLNNPEVKGAVQSFLYGALSEFFADKKNEATTKEILERCLHARKVRLMAGKASKSYDRSWLAQDANPGKLAQCLTTRDPEERELFIVEGDSAAGPAKEARDVNFQAILPLRGKPLNAYEKMAATGKRRQDALEKVFDNVEIRAILSALGARVEPVDGEMTVLLPPERRQYGKLVVLCDADSDGAHIAILVMGIIWKLLPDFVREGRLFLARPPLYRIKMDARGEQIEFAYNEEERSDAVRRSKRKGEDVVIRFKGLGEMNGEELGETVMDPKTRQLYQVQISDLVEAESTFHLILGGNAELRREWLESGDAARYLQVPA